MDSILDSVKQEVGVTANYDAFDTTIITAINTAFFTLWQLGVGRDPSAPFKITDRSAVWSDFIEDGKIEMCKTYVALRTRMIFDPPTTSFLADTINAQIREYETRMTWAVDEYNDYYK